MKEHRSSHERQQGFQNKSSGKPCRYFKKGYCAKGNQCTFKHIESYKTYAPACNQGPECRYLAQGRCYFFHPGVGIQKPQREHDFRYGSLKNRPPMINRNLSAWLDY